jgi:hypothetical protein
MGTIRKMGVTPRRGKSFDTFDDQTLKELRVANSAEQGFMITVGSIRLRMGIVYAQATGLSNI